MASNEVIPKANSSTSSHLNDASSYDIDTEPASARKTGIVCTIGPASREVDVLIELLGAGMNVVRLNLSHGSHEYHAGTIEYAREAVKIVSEEENQMNASLAIAVDTTGPDIRTGILNEDPQSEVELEKGQIIKLTADSSYAEKSTNEVLFVDYKNITTVLAPKTHIYLDHGLISLVVTSVGDSSVECEVLNGGVLGSRKCVHFVGVKMNHPALSEKDKSDIVFGVENNVDMIFASVQNAAGVQEIRKILGDEGQHIKIIPKIENREGVNNIDKIIDVSDGILVARGNLGIDIPYEKVFLAQKMIIAKCNIAGKPVICATQMLDSMIYRSRPTRAESCDVANAVLDGADCVMLSGETSRGDFPVASVSIMHAICCEAEKAACHRSLFCELITKTEIPMDTQTSTAIAAVDAALNCLATAIVVLTRTGSSAYSIAKYRPACPVLAVTKDGRVARQSVMYRAVMPLFYDEEKKSDWIEDVEQRIMFAVDFAKSKNIVKPGDFVVVVTGWTQGPGNTNTVRLLTVE